MKLVAIASFLALALFVAGCQKEPIAVVNGEEITQEMLQQQLDQRLREHKARGAAADAGALRQAVLEQMISERLLVQGAHMSDIIVTEDEVNERLSAIRARHGAEGFDQKLKESGVSLEEYVRKLRDDIMVAKFINSMVPDDSVTEEDMKKYYKESPTPFLKPEEVRVGFIQVNTREEAEAVLKEIKEAGGDFDGVADRLEKENRAVVSQYGWTVPSMFSPEIAKAMKEIKVGTYSGPLAGAQGYFIIRVADRKEEGVKSYEEAKDEIRAMFLSQKRQTALIHWVSKQRKSSDVVVNN